MIALHISILNGAPYIWSEGSQVGAIKDLQTAVKAIDLDIKVLKSNAEFLTVWLPSYKNIPVPSSPLIGAAVFYLMAEAFDKDPFLLF
ncbi:MAG: hypothetical protein L6305_01600, partial [Actinomycetia bacterium]|nr:hypothetical protein [Actinomycetes bacterium]